VRVRWQRQLLAARGMQAAGRLRTLAAASSCKPASLQRPTLLVVRACRLRMAASRSSLMSSSSSALCGGERAHVCAHVAGRRHLLDAHDSLKLPAAGRDHSTDTHLGTSTSSYWKSSSSDSAASPPSGPGLAHSAAAASSSAWWGDAKLLCAICCAAAATLDALMLPGVLGC
jgi:hypothetical protein